MKRVIFLDFDGVLADFDGRCMELFNEPFSALEDRFGSEGAWDLLFEVDPQFFRNLKPMADAHELYEGVLKTVESLGLAVYGLSGCPSLHFEKSAHQKREWAKEHFPDLLVNTCLSKDKSKWMIAGDVIIDDFDKHRHLWVNRGGHWILHENAQKSIEELVEFLLD